MAEDVLPALRWDLFCRVIDNHGDLGVCWRLARRLAALGQSVRLWIDDAAALAWMAPTGAPGVELRPWREPQADESPGDVVVEAFGCDPPPGFVSRMAAQPRPPVWINLEYLSAESYVERSHALASPQQIGLGAGLTKWFFYPGFSTATGGLLHEHHLAAERDRFDPLAWLAGHGVAVDPRAQRVSLFCYRPPALADWLVRWQASPQPTQLLVTHGLAAQQVAAWLGSTVPGGGTVERGALRAHFLPPLPQPDYDRLLWACSLNHVRGEDSWVRALWAGKPFVWQVYPQQDGAHLAKLEAFLDRYLQHAPATLADALRQRFRHWNGLQGPPDVAPEWTAWQAHAAHYAARLEAAVDRHGDLALRLQRFVSGKR